MQAYLVIREGTKWTDVFRLVPGRTVTIGRAATNQIVIKDERCSRFHAEIFMTEAACHKSLAAFEKGLEASDDAIPSSMIYAYAALSEGIPFANAAPNLTADVPAL